jgi:hypothetical protein
VNDTTKSGYLYCGEKKSFGMCRKCMPLHCQQPWLSLKVFFDKCTIKTVYIHLFIPVHCHKQSILSLHARPYIFAPVMEHAVHSVRYACVQGATY